MKKIGNRPITEADTNFSKLQKKTIRKKNPQNFSENFRNFFYFFAYLEKSVSASVIGRLPIFFMTKQSF